MSNLINMEFVHALNPLYAFPIVAVILCAFIVYAFGFKSPVQPPSFEGIEEEKKTTRKRKTKETNKNKVVQNGKLNGSVSNKAQVVPSTKKKEGEKSISADKSIVEKSTNEKKVIKKSKASNEKKTNQDKKKESFSHEDAGEDGWVQLISKKGRKSRKKDEVGTIENQTVTVKPTKNAQIYKSDEIIQSEETPKIDVTENSVPDMFPEKKVALKEEKKNADVSVENTKDKVIIIEDSQANANSLEKLPSEENMPKSGKLIEETSNKSKKKKKKHQEVVSTDNECIVSPSESSVDHVISELSPPRNATKIAPVIAETPEAIIGKVEENQPKESKSSNVVFDELAGLYPEPKEQRKKKKVRRDH